MRFLRFVFAACLLLAPAVRAQPGTAGAASADAAQVKREHDLKMPEVAAALGVVEGSEVADIGAGRGYYEPVLSRAAGAAGRVYAEDINPGALKRLRQRVEDGQLANVQIVEGAPDDPKLPAGALDCALMVIMYHEIAEPQKVLEHVRAALKPGGRLVVVEQWPCKTLTRPRADQVKNHVIAPGIVESEIRQAGFELVSRDDHFVDHPDWESTRWMIVFRKPAPEQ